MGKQIDYLVWKTKPFSLIANGVFYFDGVTWKFLFCVLWCCNWMVAVRRVSNVNLSNICAHTLHFYHGIEGERCQSDSFLFSFLSLRPFFATQRPLAMSPPPQKTPGSAEFSVWRGERNLDLVQKIKKKKPHVSAPTMWLDYSPKKRASPESNAVNGRGS